jgi:hypothetical protein
MVATHIFLLVPPWQVFASTALTHGEWNRQWEIPLLDRPRSICVLLCVLLRFARVKSVVVAATRALAELLALLQHDHSRVDPKIKRNLRSPIPPPVPGLVSIADDSGVTGGVDEDVIVSSSGMGPNGVTSWVHLPS